MNLWRPAVVVAAVVDPAEVVGEPVVGLAVPDVVGELVAPAVVAAAVVDPADVVGEPVVGLAVPVVVGETCGASCSSSSSSGAC